MSYRDSHRAKGQDYHETFSASPHRGMIWRVERSVLDRITRRYLRDAAADYLDFACGTGRILAHVGRGRRRATGVDVSASMLAVARQRAPFAEIIEGDLTREDLLGERRFDLITAFRFFPNAEDPLREAAMAALVRHLAEDGLLVFNNHMNESSSARRLARWLDRPAPDSQRLMSRAEVRALVDGAGLRILEEHPIAALPFTERRMLRPAWLLEGLERLIAPLPGVAALAQNLIYVCRRAL